MGIGKKSGTPFTDYVERHYPHIEALKPEKEAMSAMLSANSC